MAMGGNVILSGGAEIPAEAPAIQTDVHGFPQSLQENSGQYLFLANPFRQPWR
jgi:hypothetical protein